GTGQRGVRRRALRPAECDPPGRGRSRCGPGRRQRQIRQAAGGYGAPGSRRRPEPGGPRPGRAGQPVAGREEPGKPAKPWRRRIYAASSERTTASTDEGGKRVNKAELIQRVAERTGLTKKDTE